MLKYYDRPVLYMTTMVQTGIIENPNLKPEDETRPNGLHSLEGVAYLLQKGVTDLEEIEVCPTLGAFHKSRDGAGFYLVNVKDASCSCPGYRFTRSCRHIHHVEARIRDEAGMRQPATPSTPPKMSKGELVTRKARIAERNRQNAEARAATKADGPKAFRPINPDEIRATT